MLGEARQIREEALPCRVEPTLGIRASRLRVVSKSSLRSLGRMFQELSQGGMCVLVSCVLGHRVLFVSFQAGRTASDRWLEPLSPSYCTNYLSFSPLSSKLHKLPVCFAEHITIEATGTTVRG